MEPTVFALHSYPRVIGFFLPRNTRCSSTRRPFLEWGKKPEIYVPRFWGVWVQILVLVSSAICHILKNPNKTVSSNVRHSSDAKPTPANVQRITTFETVTLCKLRGYDSREACIAKYDLEENEKSGYSVYGVARSLEVGFGEWWMEGYLMDVSLLRLFESYFEVLFVRLLWVSIPFNFLASR